MAFKAIRQYLEDGKRISRMVDQTVNDLDPGEVVIKTQFAAVNYKDARGVMGIGNVIGRIPAGTDPFDSVAMGLAAYTSAVAVVELERRVKKTDGPIIVTGGTGGSPSFAIDMLAGLGYEVVASTGKTSEEAYLKSIGAIDAVGGASLDAVLRSAKKNAVICAIGNAASETLTTSIYPFILRSVSLVGINGNHPVPER